MAYARMGQEAVDFAQGVPVLLGNAEYPENIKDALDASSSGNTKIVEFDALSAALSCGSSKAVNMVMVGALSAGMDFPKEMWIEAINEAFASKAKLIPMNVKAFEMGRDFFA